MNPRAGIVSELHDAITVLEDFVDRGQRAQAVVDDLLKKRGGPEMKTTEQVRAKGLVTQARRLERLLSRRRRLARQVRDLDNQIRTARRFLRDLAMPTEEPMNRAEHGDLLPGEPEPGYSLQ
jgi:hypothetical protein